MRKLMAAVLVVSGLGLVTGCERKSELQRQREDVAEAQRDVRQEQQRANQEIAEGRQDAQKDLSQAQRNLADEQSELAAKEYDQLSDHGATGGSGLASDSMARAPIAASDKVHDTGKVRDEAAQEIQGTIQSASGSNLTLIVPDQDNKLMRFKSDKQVKVMHDDKVMSLSSLKAGDEVRASYLTDTNGQRVLRTIEVTKTSAHSLPDMPNMAK